MEKKYAKSAYRNFFFWSTCSSLGVTVSTLIDATLVGNFIGSKGLAVANIATPIFLLYSLLGITLGSGAGILIGKRLGAEDEERANRLFASVLSTGITVGVFFAVISVSFSNELCTFLGAEELLNFVWQYLFIVFCSAPIFVLYHILAAAVRTDGDPKLAAIASGGVIVTNLVLDILFMRVLNWGVAGASASLCIAETVGGLLLLAHFWKKQSLLKLRFALPQAKEIKNFIATGFGVGSSFIFQAAVIMVFNILLLQEATQAGIYAVAVFGVMYTMSTVPYALFDGAGAAASTVISILGGEKDQKGMLAVFYDGLRSVIIAGVILALAFALYTREILAFFGIAGDVSFDTAVAAFQIYAVSIVFAGINTLTTAFWQTIGRIRLAAAISILRNCVFMLAFGACLIPGRGIEGLAMAYVLGEGLCLVIMLCVLVFKSSKKYIEENYCFYNRVFERFYKIEESSIDLLAKELEQVCEEWEIGYKQSMFINLITEELILNIIKFGLDSNEKQCYVSVKLMDNNDEYILRIRDNVRTYNPFDLRGDEVDRAAMRLITKKAKYYNYQRKLVFNYLYIII